MYRGDHMRYICGGRDDYGKDVDMAIIKGFKGYDKDLKCRGHQFEVGKTYEVEGDAKLCENGFHFCEYPLDVFGYYPPANSRYTLVTGEDVSDERESSDTKVCAKKLTVGAEIDILGLVKASVEYIKERVDKSTEKKENGYQSMASNTGYQSMASNTGYRSMASVSGKESVAIATGIEAVAKGALGCWLVLGEQEKDGDGVWHLVDVKTFKVDGEIIKADTYYKFVNGEAIETELNA